MSVQPLLPLTLFTLVTLAASLYVLAALGHFPRSARQPALLGTAGGIVLWGSIAAVTASVVVAIVAAWWLIPWYAAIIAAGTPDKRDRRVRRKMKENG